MTLAQVPSGPAEKSFYDIEKLKPNVSAIEQMYPSVFRCVACSACTGSCPQGLQVMDCVQAAKRRDFLHGISVFCGARSPRDLMYKAEPPDAIFTVY